MSFQVILRVDGGNELWNLCSAVEKENVPRMRKQMRLDEGKKWSQCCGFGCTISLVAVPNTG